MPMSRNTLQRVVFYGGLALLAALGFGARWLLARPPRELRPYLAEARKLDPHWEPFAETSWSEGHPEDAGQTLAEYVRVNPNRPNARLTTLYIQPLGALNQPQRSAIDAAAEALGVVYGVPVKILPGIDLSDVPEGSWRINEQTRERQILTSYLINTHLRPNRPNDALAVIGLTATDIWPGEGWNFVFGIASLTQRVGVYSLARYGDPLRGAAEAKLYLRRTLRVAVHESGHMLGMRHCIARARCLMNGVNNAEELDAVRWAFCPECSAKVWWATGAKPGAWLGAMRDLAARREMDEESEFLARCAEAFK